MNASRVKAGISGAWYLLTHSRARARFLEVTHRLEGKRGLEIGGPSGVFRRFRQWPIYGRRIQLDNLDFAPETIWSGVNGRSQYRATLIGEASTLDAVSDNSYECLISSHVLEHIANPIAALLNWRRVVVANGLIIAVAPHSEGTFDHLRALTTIEHMWTDYVDGTTEQDSTHMSEVVSRHDLSRDPGGLNRDAFVERMRGNWRTRSMHHHVLITETLARLFDMAGLRLVYVDTARPYHICAVAEVPDTASPPRFATVLEANRQFLDDRAEWRRRSPFHSDRTPLPQ
jgi:hypothetical protein